MNDLLYSKVITQKHILLNEQLQVQMELLLQEQKNVLAENRRFKQRATKHVRILELFLVIFLSIVYEQYSGYESLVLSGVIMTNISFLESMLQNLKFET